MAKPKGIKKKINKLNDQIKKNKLKLQKALVKKRKTKQKSPTRLKVNKRVRELQKRIRWSVAKRTILRKKYKKAKEKASKGKIEFESWMLNGCPSNIHSDLKKPIAIGVLLYDQVVTATSNGQHSSGSYHYYNPIRGVDMASWSVSDMKAFQNKLFEKYGLKFRELFGPDSFYVKNGVKYSGVFPAHGDHLHIVRNF